MSTTTPVRPASGGTHPHQTIARGVSPPTKQVDRPYTRQPQKIARAVNLIVLLCPGEMLLLPSAVAQ